MNMKQIIELISVSLDVAGVVVLMIGTLCAFIACAGGLFRRERRSTLYRALRRKVGKSILMGLELLVAADIVRTVGIDPTFITVGVLGLIVLIRTFLSWSLEVEINGTWPWQHASLPQPDSPGTEEL